MPGTSPSIIYSLNPAYISLSNTFLKAASFKPLGVNFVSCRDHDREGSWYTFVLIIHSTGSGKSYLCLSSVHSLSRVWLFVTPWTAARQASLSITNSRSPPKPTSIESVMTSNHLILCVHFSSCCQSFPASGSFPMSHSFASGAQSIGVLVSASVLPMNTWTDLL